MFLADLWLQKGQLRGDEPLFDPEILKRLDFSRCKAKFKPLISARDPGEGLLVRPLCPDDYDRGRYTVINAVTLLSSHRTYYQ
jgi:hypothetical protein